MARGIEGEVVVVVTGASSVIGEATARHLADRLAISRPEEVDINGILFRPTAQEL